MPKNDDGFGSLLLGVRCGRVPNNGNQTHPFATTTTTTTTATTVVVVVGC